MSQNNGDQGQTTETPRSSDQESFKSWRIRKFNIPSAKNATTVAARSKASRRTRRSPVGPYPAPITMPGCESSSTHQLAA